MNDFHLDQVNQLEWLILVPLAVAVCIYGFARRSAALRAFTSSRLLAVLAPDISLARLITKSALLIVAMLFLVLALTGPRWGTYFEPVQSRKMDIVICLDVSRSMLAEDAGMSRLDRAKDDIRRLLDKIGGGQVGLVAFAGRAELICPLTDDYEYYRLALDDVGMHSVTLGGTNLGDAIAAGSKTFGNSVGKNRAIILMTDGEDTHGGKGEEEAKKAYARGISVYTIGIGDTEKGALIPIDKDGQKTYLKYDEQQVWSKMDPGTLKAVAAAAGGEYQPSRQVNPRQRTLEWLYTTRLAPQEERTMKEQKIPRQYARFHWFAAIALALLLMEPLISERRRTPASASIVNGADSNSNEGNSPQNEGATPAGRQPSSMEVINT
jgi:Ca-activated chloride channel family protein